MIKSIFKLSCLILGLIFLSAANAETCKEKYNDQDFEHVTIWKNDHTVYCYYHPNCATKNCPPGGMYLLYNYEPNNGPWKSNDVLSSCSVSAEDCRFKKVGN